MFCGKYICESTPHTSKLKFLNVFASYRITLWGRNQRWSRPPSLKTNISQSLFGRSERSQYLYLISIWIKNLSLASHIVVTEELVLMEVIRVWFMFTVAWFLSQATSFVVYDHLFVFAAFAGAFLERVVLSVPRCTFNEKKMILAQSFFRLFFISRTHSSRLQSKILWLSSGVPLQFDAYRVCYCYSNDSVSLHPKRSIVGNQLSAAVALQRSEKEHFAYFAAQDLL